MVHPMNFTQSDGSLLFPFSPDKSSETFSQFLQAYCIAPPDDTCGPPGRCPNFDAAGILVRGAAYSSNFFLSLIIIYCPQAARESFWSLMLFVYSLLITSTISIANRQLTRFHASITAELAGSPMVFILFLYVVLGSAFGYEHRMSHVLGGTRRTKGGKGVRWLANFAVVGAMLWWLAFMIFVVRPGSSDFFSQTACDSQVLIEALELILLILPYGGFFVAMWQWVQWDHVWYIWEVGPIVIVAAGLVFVLVWRRREIRILGDGKFVYWNAWRYFGEQYPFLHFMAAVFLNFLYWLFFIENRMIGTHDNHFSLSFGQILAIFSTIPPFLQALTLLPSIPLWFIDLAWVRILTCRPQKRSKVNYNIKNEHNLDEAVPFRRSRVKNTSSGTWDGKAEKTSALTPMLKPEVEDPWSSTSPHGYGHATAASLGYDTQSYPTEEHLGYLTFGEVQRPHGAGYGYGRAESQGYQAHTGAQRPSATGHARADSRYPTIGQVQKPPGHERGRTHGSGHRTHSEEQRPPVYGHVRVDTDYRTYVESRRPNAGDVV
ncbi:hypothetical protein DL96DRAFT_1704355 [Flagelloscypha sp. PMI_526]|nr:hypothetical protein DL96DRAFT_1704355 [Flagelloscypha sp. PMI_526]